MKKTRFTAKRIVINAVLIALYIVLGFIKIPIGNILRINMASFAVVMCAPELLGILAPDSYQTALWVVPPVTVSVYFTFLYNLFATFEYYYEKTHYVATATVVGAVLNVVLNAIFIPKFGFVAAGYTTLVCFMLYAFSHYFFMRKVNQVYMDGAVVYDVKIILALGAALLLCSFLVMLLYPMPIVRYGILAVLAAGVVWKRKTLFDLLQTIKSKS